MAKNQNTFEKVRREAEKKRKAHDKRERKRLKKQNAASDGEVDSVDEPQRPDEA